MFLPGVCKALDLWHHPSLTYSPTLNLSLQPRSLLTWMVSCGFLFCSVLFWFCFVLAFNICYVIPPLLQTYFHVNSLGDPCDLFTDGELCFLSFLLRQWQVLVVLPPHFRFSESLKLLTRASWGRPTFTAALRVKAKGFRKMSGAGSPAADSVSESWKWAVGTRQYRRGQLFCNRIFLTDFWK